MKDTVIEYGKGIGFAVVAVILLFVSYKLMNKSVQSMPQVKALTDKIS